MQPAENRRRFDAETDRKLVPTGGGRHPIWSRDGRELFYESPESHVMAAAYIAKADSFAADKPPLVQHADPRTPYGQRIHAARPWNTLGVREMCTGPALDGSPFQAISAQRAILSIARFSGRIRQARPFVNTSDYPRVITVHAPAASTSTSRRLYAHVVCVDGIRERFCNPISRSNSSASTWRRSHQAYGGVGWLEDRRSICGILRRSIQPRRGPCCPHRGSCEAFRSGVSRHPCRK